MGLYTTDYIRLSMSKEIELKDVVIRKTSKYAIEITYNDGYARLTNTVLKTIVKENTRLGNGKSFFVDRKILSMLSRLWRKQ